MNAEYQAKFKTMKDRIERGTFNLGKIFDALFKEQEENKKENIIDAEVIVDEIESKESN